MTHLEVSWPCQYLRPLAEGLEDFGLFEVQSKYFHEAYPTADLDDLGGVLYFAGRIVKYVENYFCRGLDSVQSIYGSNEELTLDAIKVITTFAAKAFHTRYADQVPQTLTVNQKEEMRRQRLNKLGKDNTLRVTLNRGVLGGVSQDTRSTSSKVATSTLLAGIHGFISYFSCTNPWPYANTTVSETPETVVEDNLWT